MCGILGLMASWALRGDKLLGKRDAQAEFDELKVPEAVARATMGSQFISDTVDDTNLPPAFYDGVKAQEVIEAVIQSVQRGCWVPVLARSQPECYQGQT